MPERKSFVLHIDSLSILDELSDEHSGQILKAMLHYQSTGEVVLSGMLKIVFLPFKNQFDRDNAKYQAICERNKINGIRGGRVEARTTQNNPVGSSGGQNNPVGADNDSKNDNDSKSRNNIKPDGVSDTVWSDFIAHRKAKKAPITQTAIKGFQREADKAGLSLEKAIEITILRGWTGFNAEWLKNAGASTIAKPAEPPRRKFNPNDED